MAARTDIIVIGGGASGMLAAISAARRGAKVTVLEKEERLGRKLLATGNGKCNFTNQYQTLDCHYVKDKEKLKVAFSKFGMLQTIDFFRELGVLPTEKNGYYYPRSGQAETVVRFLQREMERLKIKVKCKEQVTKILPYTDFFEIQTKTYAYEANKVILAAGGMASPGLGGSEEGYFLVKELGHTVTPLYPGLTGLVAKESYFSGLAGVRVQAALKLLLDGKETASEKGEVQLTAYGLSGIPIFQLCHPASVALAEKKQVQIEADFLPELTKEEFAAYIETQIERNPKAGKTEIYSGIFDKKLAKVLAEKEGKTLCVTIKNHRGFEQAQVTAGGVPLDEVEEKTFASLKCPGLYLTGELLDVDGICGGYNLQWAWTSGWLAGQAAAGTEET